MNLSICQKQIQRFPVTRPVVFSPIRGGWEVHVTDSRYYVARWADVLRVGSSPWHWQPARGRVMPLSVFVTQHYNLACFLRDLQAAGVRIPADPDSPDYRIERQPEEPRDAVTWRVYYAGAFLGTLYELGVRDELLYRYVGELYGNDPCEPDTLEGWQSAFQAVAEANGFSYGGLVTRDGGETYIDPESGKALLERVSTIKK